MLLPSGLPGVTNDPTQTSGVDEEEHDEGPARVDGVHAGQRQPDQREAEEDHELRGLVEVRRPARRTRGRCAKRSDHGRREGGGEQQVAPPRRRPHDEVGQHERRDDHQPHRVGEDADGDGQRRPERVPAREQRQPGQGERQGQHEGVLAVRQVQRHDEREAPGGPDVVDLPHVAHVQVERHRDRAGGEDDDERAGDVLREPVEDEPVGDGAVAAAVPVRVPEDRVAVAQQEDLVGVGGVVPARDAAPAP